MSIQSNQTLSFIRRHPGSCIAGGLLGAAAAMAISWFKGSSTAATIGSAFLSAGMSSWSFGKTASERDRRRTICCLIPALLFAAFSVIGFCFAMDSTPERLYASKTDLLKAAGAFCG